MALPGDDQHRHLWQTFLQSDAGHAGLEKQHQEETDLHRADYKARIKPIQLRELADALEGCSRDVKRAVAPLLEYECVHHILYGVLVSCHTKKVDFSDHLQSHSIRKQLEQLAEDVRINAQNGVDVDGEYWAGVTRKLNATEHPTRFVDLDLLRRPESRKRTPAVARVSGRGSHDVALSATRAARRRSSSCACAIRRRGEISELHALLPQRRGLRAQARQVPAQFVEGVADPGDIRARYKLGVAYARRGDAGRADACFAAIVGRGEGPGGGASRETEGAGRADLRATVRPRRLLGGPHLQMTRSPAEAGRAALVDGDGPALGRDAVVELQRRTLELYRSGSATCRRMWQRLTFKADLLAELGFAGERGARRPSGPWRGFSRTGGVCECSGCFALRRVLCLLSIRYGFCYSIASQAT